MGIPWARSTLKKATNLYETLGHRGYHAVTDMGLPVPSKRHLSPALQLLYLNAMLQTARKYITNVYLLFYHPFLATRVLQKYRQTLFREAYMRRHNLKPEEISKKSMVAMAEKVEKEESQNYIGHGSAKKASDAWNEVKRDEEGKVIIPRKFNIIPRFPYFILSVGALLLSYLYIFIHKIPRNKLC